MMNYVTEPQPVQLVPGLIPDLIEPILILALRLTARPAFATTTEVLSGGIAKARAQTPNATLMAAPVFVAFHLDPVARVLLLMLAHAWPLTTPAAHGRVDVLEKARSLRLIHPTLDGSVVAGIVASAIHHDAGQVAVLRWVTQHWPATIATNFDAARKAVMRAGLWDERGVDMLDFWFAEATADSTQDRALLHEGMFATHIVQAALEQAFLSNNTSVLQWWADHAHVNWEIGAHWDWDWVDHSLVTGALSVVRVCAELEEAGKVRFLKGEPLVAGAYSGVRALDPEGKALMGNPIKLADTVLDRASEVGQLEMLRYWKQHTTSLEYSERAMDSAPSPEVLDWWADESGLPLKYTHRAIHYATANGNTSVLSWWLAKFRSQRISELKYDAWIMTIASVSCAFDRHTGSVKGVHKDDTLPLDRRIAVLNWWDVSGLDLKLPKLPATTSATLSSNQPCKWSVAPSPIDMCTSPPVLTWWLTRAQRLRARNAKSTLESHFPPYSCTAIHRAAYVGSTRALEWWFITGGALAGLELRYVLHRPVELATMAGMASYKSALDWWFATLPIKFRGSLLEWAKLRPSSAVPGATVQVARDWELERLKGLCMRFRVTMDGGGGLLPPEGGYVKQEPGEEFVFFPQLP